MKSTTYEFFILAVSILSIVNMALIALLPWGSQSWWVIACIDIGLKVIFLVDFGFRQLATDSKRGYLVQGRRIFDPLGCMPALCITGYWSPLARFAERAGELGEALRDVERLLDEQERTTATLRTRIAEFESRA